MKLEEKQREMIEYLVYHVFESQYDMDVAHKAKLIRVLERDSYNEEERSFLNRLRKSYLNGEYDI